MSPKCKVISKKELLQLFQDYRRFLVSIDETFLNLDFSNIPETMQKGISRWIKFHRETEIFNSGKYLLSEKKYSRNELMKILNQSHFLADLALHLAKQLQILDHINSEEKDLLMSIILDKKFCDIISEI